jgi:hypothetical protein
MLLEKQLDTEEMCRMLGMDKDGQLDKCDYVVRMLTRLEMVPQTEVQKLLDQFAELDADGSVQAHSTPPIHRFCKGYTPVSWP